MRTKSNKHVKIMGWLIAIPLLWYIIIPYINSLLYEKNYKTTSIYIPKVKETLYLINYNYPDSGQGNRIELSTCNWRIFSSEDKEFWYPMNSIGIEYSESSQTFYYKVSNDTLFVSVYTAIDIPKQWKSKVVIVQEEDSHFITEEGIHGWLTVDEEKRKKEREQLGYTKFP